MYIPPALLFIPYASISLLHLFFCIQCKKRPADILKVMLMPLLIIPVSYSWYTRIISLQTLILLSGALTGAWAGDYYLIKPVSKKKFFYGLLAFFLSHVCYVLLFIPLSSINMIPLPISVLYVILSTVLIAGIYTLIGRPKGLRGAAAIVYTAMLLVLQYICVSPLLVHFMIQHINIGATHILLVCGVLLFTISDLLLAYSLFKKEFKYSRFSVMSTYIAAQFFLVLGIICQV